MKRNLSRMIGAALLTLFAGAAAAVPIVPSDYVSNTNAGALQAYFDQKGWGLNVIDDQIQMPTAWTLTNASSASNMTFYHEELTGGVSFGIYSTDTMQRAEVFGIGDTPIAKAQVNFLNNTVLVIQTFDANNLFIDVTYAPFAGSRFGFYIADSSNNVVYSDASLNAGDRVGILAYNAAPGSYVFAGDLDGTGKFNNVVAQAESIAPVPEPATMFLLGSGLIGLGGWARRKSKT